MPNTSSAKKRVRQTKKRTALNNWRKRRVKDQTKAVLKAIAAGDVAAAETEFRKAAAILDRVADANTIHKNTASRRKSRLARRINILKAGGKPSDALAANQKSAGASAKKPKSGGRPPRSGPSKS